MVIEQRSEYPLGFSRINTVKPGSKITLKKRGGQDEKLFVLTPDNVRHDIYLEAGGEKFPISFENDTPQEINDMGLVSEGRIVRRTYSWREPAVEPNTPGR